MIRAVALWAGTRIVVPDDIDVDVRDFGVFGGHAARGAARPGAPRVEGPRAVRSRRHQAAPTSPLTPARHRETPMTRRGSLSPPLRAANNAHDNRTGGRRPPVAPS
ncbi:hypothetical protein ACE1SV_41050 [Streptomyces sp. E-15]